MPMNRRGISATQLARDYAVIREGEIALTDLWFELWARRVAAETGRAPGDVPRDEVARLHPPPARIDFRMIS